MSRFFSQRHAALRPYTPGEQPQDMRYIKLNTNESPFPPGEHVILAASLQAARLNLYCDPACAELCAAAERLYNVHSRNILPLNGSDEGLFLAFLAFCDENNPIAFPDISYGFYPVFAKLNHIPVHKIALREDFSINVKDYLALGQTIVIANPNAPTGICLGLQQIEQIVASNPDNVVIIDEAYIDFGGKSCVLLTKEYENLLVMQTFSKSRSLAGARLGFAIGNEKLLEDLCTLKDSINPYNVNSMTQAAGIAAIEDNVYYMGNCKTIKETREYTTTRLEELGFRVLPSSANFVFAESDRVSGESLYRMLKSRGVLVRHFSDERIKNFIRISMGTTEQMDILLTHMSNILNRVIL